MTVKERNSKYQCKKRHYEIANIVGILLGASHYIPKRGLKMRFVQDTPSFASAIIGDIT
jgi:hypothetical protein